MNKLRIFQNIKNKERTASGLIRMNPGTVLLIFLFLPYLITILFGNSHREDGTEMQKMILEQLKDEYYTVVNETAIGRETISLELYVADKLMRTMEEGYEREALKAQAVLLRSNLITGDDMSITVSDEWYGQKEIPEEYLIAVMQTKGIYVQYDGKAVYGAYFRVSNGETRQAAETLQPENYPYLAGAVCDRDFLSKEYASTVTYGKREFEKKWEEMEYTEPKEDIIVRAKEDNRYEERGDGMAFIRDCAGYVLFLKYRDQWVSGEELRYALSLPSCAFSIKENGSELVFSCKGLGHGFGMSQFGANEMALDGKTYIEILQYFFEGITLTKIS